MPTDRSDRQERQFEHVRRSYLERGRSPEKAAELAARVVNKQRRRAGETKRSPR